LATSLDPSGGKRASPAALGWRNRLEAVVRHALRRRDVGEFVATGSVRELIRDARGCGA
jgi:hypothetical protein